MNNINKFLTECNKRMAFSGAAYAIGTSNSVLEKGVIGTLKWDGDPVTMDSLWDMASLTKPIVAVLLMKLFEQGEICIDDKISYFLPEYEKTNKASITIQQLLTHTSGIPGEQPIYQIAKTPEDMMVAVRNLPLRFMPGTDVEYTSQGFMIVGKIIEKITGMRLDAAMQELLLNPLAMNNTCYNPSKDIRDTIAATEYCNWRGYMVCGEVHDENCLVLGGIAGHAGLFSNTEDLTKLCQTMLRYGEATDKQFLKPATVKFMTQNYTGEKKLARALGWQAKDRFGSPGGDLFSSISYGHTGFTGTSIWIDPKSDIFAILLTNRVHPSRDNDSIKRVRAIFHNLVNLDFVNTK
jgi:CubicO group peptidase (beta-lactamase class C family)